MGCDMLREKKRWIMAVVAVPTLPIEGNQGTEKNQKGWFKKIFNKVADSAGRATVTGAMKIAVVTTLAGAGASTVLTLGAAAVAAGTGAALYSYGKDLTFDWLRARKTGETIALWDCERAKRARLALLVGTAGGAFGAWLAGTDVLKEGLALLKETGMKTAGLLSGAFIQSASAAELPQDLMGARKNPLEKLWFSVMKSDQVNGKFMGELFKADPDNMKSVSPQYLKDRAHDILRINDIPWAERLDVARSLAEEARSRGNRQAVQFLKDLARLEALHGVPEVPDVLPQAEIAEPLPVKTVIIETNDAGQVTERIVEAETGASLVIENMSSPLSPQFDEAASCVIASSPVADEMDADCVIHKQHMAPGDYISFVANDETGYRPVVPLSIDSVSVETESFLNEKTVAEGIRKLVTPGVR